MKVTQTLNLPYTANRPALNFPLVDDNPSTHGQSLPPDGWS